MWLNRAHASPALEPAKHVPDSGNVEYSSANLPNAEVIRLKCPKVLKPTGLWSRLMVEARNVLPVIIMGLVW